MGYGTELLADYEYERELAQKEFVCGRCEWNRCSKKNNTFYCGNTDSQKYKCSTKYTDSCTVFNERNF